MDAKIQAPPCHGQTTESVETWLRANVDIGRQVAIRDTQGGVIQYRLANVIRLGKGRFQLDKAGAVGGVSFYYSGKNCFHPKGQTRLVEPTPAVIAAAEGKTVFGFLRTTV